MNAKPGEEDGRPAVLWLAYALTTAGITATTLIVAAVPEIISEFRVDSGSAGWVLASGTAPGIMAAPVIGRLADRIGIRQVLLGSLAIVALFGLLTIVANSFMSLITLRALQGVGSASLTGLAFVIIVNQSDGHRRAALLSRNAAVLAVSAALGPLLGGILTSLWGWRSIGWVFIFCLMLIPSVLRQIPLMRSPAPAEVLPRIRREMNRDIGLLIGAGCLCFVLYFGLLQTMLPFLAVERFNADPTLRGLLIGLAAVPAILAPLVIVPMSRIRIRWMVSGSLAGYGIIALFAGQISLFAGLVVVALGIGASNGLVMPLVQRRLADLSPVESRAAVLLRWTAAVRAGQSFGPVLGAVVLQWYGITDGFSMIALGACVAAGSTLGIALFREHIPWRPPGNAT